MASLALFGSPCCQQLNCHSLSAFGRLPRSLGENLLPTRPPHFIGVSGISSSSSLGSDLARNENRRLSVQSCPIRSQSKLAVAAGAREAGPRFCGGYTSMRDFCRFSRNLSIHCPLHPTHSSLPGSNERRFRVSFDRRARRRARAGRGVFVMPMDRRLLPRRGSSIDSGRRRRGRRRRRRRWRWSHSAPVRPRAALAARVCVAACVPSLAGAH